MGMPVLVLPRLEEPLARHELGELADELELVPWDETDDPIRARPAARRRGAAGRRAGPDVGALRAAPARGARPRELVEAGPTMSALRRIKDAGGGRPAARGRGRRGRGDARDHRRAAVGPDARPTSAAASGSCCWTPATTRPASRSSPPGPNSASPHHEAGDRAHRARGRDRARHRRRAGRLLQRHDPHRVRRRPDPEFVALYEVLREAQAAACDAVRPGVPAAEIDAVARDIIDEAGYGEAFIHRTGHGIGMETHEEPYIVASNAEPLVAGHAFSVEPGIYIRDRGARASRTSWSAPRPAASASTPRARSCYRRLTARVRSAALAVRADERDEHLVDGRVRLVEGGGHVGDVGRPAAEVADDRVEHRRAEEEEGLDRLGQATARRATPRRRRGPPIFSASSSSSWRSARFVAATYSITSWNVRWPHRRNSSRCSAERRACQGCPA